MLLKPFKVHSADGKHFYEGDAPTPAVRPVTPLICPKCNALWLFWPKEQADVEYDSLNLRSEKSCDFCEPAGVEQLKSLNRLEPNCFDTTDQP